MAGFLLMLREGVEAALIVAILLAYLRRLDLRTERRWVWGGTLAAVALSLLTGIILYLTLGGLEGSAEEIAEGTVAAMAAGLLTWMIFWMARQARTIRARLESQAESALLAGSATGLALVAFVAVLREGLESALFMISTTVGEASAAGQLVGGLLGISAAVAIGYLMYQGASRLNLRAFFRVTGVLLILFAAGLVAKAIHELQEADVIGTITEHVWNVGILDPDTSTVGQFLASLFGWSPDPSLLMVVGYLLYGVPVLWAFLSLTAARPQPADIRP